MTKAKSTSAKPMPEQKAKRGKGRPRKEGPKDYVSFTIRTDATLLNKLRAIARQTNTTLKSVMDATFKQCVDNFEAKFGPVDTDAKAMDVNALFSNDADTVTKK